MNTPDSEPRAGKSRRTARRRGGLFSRVLLAGTVIAIAFLTLMPKIGRTRFRIVPMPVYHWFVGPEHDWLMNIIAFGFLALVVFRVEKNADSRRGRFAAIWAHRRVRLAALLALVCLIETVQKWIPGRISSLDDVCTGWSGIFAAWLLGVLGEKDRMQ